MSAAGVEEAFLTCCATCGGDGDAKKENPTKPYAGMWMKM